jgi:hypothetical protein
MEFWGKVVAVFADPRVVTGYAVILWALALAVHFTVVGFVARLHKAWWYGLRLQEECGENEAMEGETVRYQWYQAVRNTSKVEAARKQVKVMGSLVGALCAVPALWLVAFLMMTTVRQVEGSVWGTRETPVPPLPGVVVMGALVGVVTVVTQQMFLRMVGKTGNALLERFSTTYRAALEKVRTDILAKMEDCSMKPKDEKDRCKSLRLLEQLRQSILETDQLDSPQIADMQLKQWISEAATDTGNTGLIRYVRFNKYGPDRAALHDYASVAADSLTKLETLSFGDPSSAVRPMMRRWRMYLFFATFLLLFLLFHNVYHHVDRIVMMLMFLAAAFLLLMVGFVQMA